MSPVDEQWRWAGYAMVKTSDGKIVFSSNCGCDVDFEMSDDGARNVRIAEAAPELLAALKELVEQCSWARGTIHEEVSCGQPFEESQPVVQARALIARIEGGK